MILTTFMLFMKYRSRLCDVGVIRTKPKPERIVMRRLLADISTLLIG